MEEVTGHHIRVEGNAGGLVEHKCDRPACPVTMESMKRLLAVLRLPYAPPIDSAEMAYVSRN